MKPDLTYLDTGLFVSFFAETPAGEGAWDELARHSDGSGRFLSIHREAITAQLRAAGYTVAKRKPAKRAGPDDDAALLAELGV